MAQAIRIENPAIETLRREKDFARHIVEHAVHPELERHRKRTFVAGACESFPGIDPRAAARRSPLGCIRGTF